MLTHPADPSCTLVELADLARDPPPATLARDREALATVVAWARQYLCHPHPELGRPGPVCPYAEASLERGTFWLAVRRGRPEPEEVERALRRYRDWFADLEPRDGPGAQLKTILVLFPELGAGDVARVVDGTQARLKPGYVARGLMVGEFHPGPPDKGGLWRASFRPLRSPVPLLAIRHMVPTDFPFLRDDREQVAAYLARFGGQVPARLQGMVAAARERFGLDPEGRLARARD